MKKMLCKMFTVMNVKMSECAVHNRFISVREINVKQGEQNKNGNKSSTLTFIGFIDLDIKKWYPKTVFEDSKQLGRLSVGWHLII